MNNTDIHMTEDFEEGYITDLLSYPFDNGKQSIFCYFPEGNFSMVSIKDEYRSLQCKTLFVPTKVEKTAYLERPYSIHVYCAWGYCVLTPHRDCWDTRKPKMIKFKNPTINYKTGDLYKVYTSTHAVVQQWPLTNSDYTNIQYETRLKQDDHICLLKLKDRKAKVLTLDGIIGWIPSILLKKL